MRASGEGAPSGADRGGFEIVQTLSLETRSDETTVIISAKD